MTEVERLVQRFLDQELSPEERMAFVVRLGRDAALRERVLVLEQVLLEASRLPRPVVPDDFVSGVLARTMSPEPAWRRLLDALRAPRTLRWNLAGAMAAACLVVLVVGGGVVGLLSGGSTVAGNGAQATPVLVRLVVVQPGAMTVAAAGDFNGWDPAQTPLEPTANGAWSVTLPLEPGRYEYMFVVDGEDWIVDPFAVEQSDDGFGAQNAVLEVRPPTELSL
jgi:hypothetical protein